MILFSTKDAQYAFGETDQDGRRNVESFAAQHRPVINFMPAEGRVYFVRDPNELLKISLVLEMIQTDQAPISVTSHWFDLQTITV